MSDTETFHTTSLVISLLALILVIINTIQTNNFLEEKSKLKSKLDHIQCHNETIQEFSSITKEDDWGQQHQLCILAGMAVNRSCICSIYSAVNGTAIEYKCTVTRTREVCEVK